jgi:transcriptional regulator with XRE-family HTH domain
MRQADCADLAGVHRSTWSIVERGHLNRTSLDVLRRCFEVLEVRLEITPSWRGADLGRLLDEAHASLEAAWKARLEDWGWHVWVEKSFNQYGDRGRVDLLAWHPTLRFLVVAEVKTEIVDAQALLGGMDMKVRVAPRLARSLGLGTTKAVLPLLLVLEGNTNRDRIRRLGPLFARFAVRGREAVSWLRQPHAAASGLLILSSLRPATGSSVKRVGPHRMRRS